MRSIPHHKKTDKQLQNFLNRVNKNGIKYLLAMIEKQARIEKGIWTLNHKK